MIWIPVAIYACFALVPLLAFVEADTATRRWVFVACLFTIGISAQRFTTTPDGILQDTLEYAAPWARRDTTTIPELFSQYQTNHCLGWNVALVGLAHRLLGTWLVERLLGLGWGCLVIVALYCLPLGLPIRGLPITVAILVATPAGLWLQRHHAGMELVLQQVFVLSALWKAQESRAWARVAGVCVALGAYNYLAALVWFAYPAIALRHRRDRMRVVYETALVCCLPVVAMWDCNSMVAYEAGPIWHYADVQQRIVNVAYAFLDPAYSQAVSWNWSYPGAQQWTPIACACLVVGLAYAATFAQGRTLLAIGLVGFLPSITSTARGAASHREMMALVPLALLAGAWSPRRWVACLLGAGIAVEGWLRWSAPTFWDAWAGGQLHGF